MNTTAKFKSLLAGAVAAAGLMATAETTVKVDKVETGNPWSTVTVDYTLDGVDAATDYKVAFDVTANGVTKGCTNEAAKLTDGSATKVLDTAELFGTATADPKAKVRVSLVAVKLDGVQLWENGPYFAECNVGATTPQEYGYYFWWGDTVGYTNTGSGWISADGRGTSILFSNTSPANTLYGKDDTALVDYVDANGNLKPAYDAATAHLGSPWRMMTKDELAKLVSTDYCRRQRVTEYKGVSVDGYVVKGKEGTAYENNEVFFPAVGFGDGSSIADAGSEGGYWSSTPYSNDPKYAWLLLYHSGDFEASLSSRFYGRSVRPVR